jgi:hypothetical protein
MLKKLDSNPKMFAIVYGAIGSIVASVLWVLAPTLGVLIANSGWSILVSFINQRFEAAATLEPVNYSFFLLTALFIVVVILWFEISGKAKKKLLGKQELDTITQFKEPSRFMRLSLYFFIQLLMPLYLIYVLFQVSGQVVTLNAISDFKQHMRIVAPYITLEEEKQILSKWSLMKSFEDYESINRRLIEIVKANDLSLPRTKNITIF